MARLQYFVVLHQGEWKIGHDGKHIGPYADRKLAIQAAIELARQTGHRGHDAQVLIEGENNLFKTEWTYGRDPYPPQG